MSDAEYIKAVEDENGRLKELVDKLNFRIAELEEERAATIRNFLGGKPPNKVIKPPKKPSCSGGYPYTYTSNNTGPTYNLEELKKNAQAGTIIEYVNKITENQ